MSPNHFRRKLGSLALCGLGSCSPSPPGPVMVNVPPPPAARAGRGADLSIHGLSFPSDSACVLSVSPFLSAVDRRGDVTTALHVSSGTAPFALLSNAEAAVVAIASNTAAPAGYLSAQTGGVFIQGFVAPVVFFLEEHPPEQFVRWTGRTPLLVEGATRIADRVVLSLTYRAEGLSAYRDVATTAFCDSVSPQPTELDSSRPSLARVQLSKAQTPLALSQHEDFVDEIQTADDGGRAVEVLHADVVRTRIAWNNGESWLEGWVATDDLSPLDAVTTDRPTIGTEPPIARGGFFEAIVCPHDVPLIVETSSRQVRVGAALRGTTLRLREPPNADLVSRAQLVELDLDADGLRLVPPARWWTPATALNACRSIR